jgi:hypothetical protein
VYASISNDGKNVHLPLTSLDKFIGEVAGNMNNASVKKKPHLLLTERGALPPAFRIKDL